jgi:SAM-dependent methyltransferase
MPNKFSYRSNEKELLDESNILRDQLFNNLRELDTFNKFAGGHAILLKGIKQLITDHHKIYHVVDLGCGSGDALKAIAKWARSKKFRVRLTGIDLNAHAIEYMKIYCMNYPEITGFISDYSDYITGNESIDIIHCSLFCHHLNDNELLQLFIYCRQYVKTGFIINDLHRSRLAYYSAWLFTRLLNGSELAKHDGPVSVLRGFKYGELNQLLLKAEIMDYAIQNEWAFRFLIIGKTNNHDPKA